MRRISSALLASLLLSPFGLGSLPFGRAAEPVLLALAARHFAGFHAMDVPKRSDIVRTIY